LLAGAIHPYLALMTWVLTVALFVRLKLARAVSSWWRVGLAIASLSVALVLVFWVFGYMTNGVRIEGGGFGRYSADVTTLFNAMGYSNYLPGLPLEAGQYEGFAYLGGGALLLGLFALVIVSPFQVAPSRWRAVLPLSVACMLLAVFAVSGTVRFAGQRFVGLEYVYARFQSLVEAFRSSGRFVWPLHYLCISLALAIVGRTFSDRPRLGRSVLAIAVAMQLADLNVLPTKLKLQTNPLPELNAAAWPLASGTYDHMALYPPQIYGADCGAPEWDEAHVYRFAYAAYKLHMTINSGYVARFDVTAVNDACRANKERLARRELDDRTVYVPSAGVAFPRELATCGQLDGREVCVAAGRPTAFSEALAH
jgi:hypothetical protein